MELSTAGLNLIKQSEGFRSNTYLDAAAIPTIGYGHRLVHPESYPLGITDQQAEIILLWDIREAEQAITRLVQVPLTQNQFDALVDFTFNLGSGRLAASTLLAHLNAGKYADAASELLRWDHAGSRELASLKARRHAEYQLWNCEPVPQQAAA